VDPQDQFASPYLAMGNNPVMGIDPDGEFVFSAILPGIGTFIDAALWGAVIGGAGYTANVAFSPGGFNNWNGGQFWQSVGMGAVSGVATAGIGSMMGPVGSQGFAGEIGRAMLHGQANMMVGVAFGRNPSMNSYLTGFSSSLGGSSFMMYGGKFANSTAGLYGFSGMAGGLTSSATGGNFWQGAAVGIMNAGLNHAKANIDAAGAEYFANKKAFYDHLWKKSFDKDGKPVREVNGWELENGDAIALDYSENTINISKWNSLKFGKMKGGGVGVEFKGVKYKVVTSAHTHPRNDFTSDGKLYAPNLSPSDKLHIDATGLKTIHVLYNKNIWLLGSGNRKNLGAW
jgi:hypothetical protein